jgi:hypothetical protein
MRLGAVLGAAGLAVAALTGWAGEAPPVRFAAVFRDTTMRVDYFHTGDAGREIFALDRIVSDGRWAGSRTILLDSLNLGTWRFTVLDSASGEVLYSRGYSSLYAEWETTNPGSATTFHERSAFPGRRRRCAWCSSGGTRRMPGSRPGASVSARRCWR